MTLLKPLQIALLMIATLYVTSCTVEESVKDTNTTTRMETNVLRPAGPTVTLAPLEDFSILIPEHPTDQESFSAAMLAEYLKKIFNTPFPVLQEPQVVEGKIISVGNTSAASTANIVADPREQAYKLEVQDGNLYILGGTRGPIYGVIALLEEDLGCRWYALRPDTRLSPSTQPGPVIPSLSKDAFTVVPRSYAPPFEVRDVFYWDAFSLSADWAVFNRIQSLSNYNKMEPEAGGGLSNPTYWIHTYSELVPAEKYFDTHPEYFPLRGGKRHPSTISNGQLCYTSTGVVEVITKKLEAEIAKHPATRIYSVSSNDNVHDNCECEPCQEIIKLDGIPGAQLHLANEVAANLAVNHPDIRITTLAYVNSQKPPKHIKPGPNTVIFYAPIRQRHNRVSRLIPIGEIEEIADELADWNEIASHIYLWDYVDIIGGTPIPYPNLDAQDLGWEFLIENGVTGVFMQGSFIMSASLGELKSWLFAKKLWNPSWPQDELVEEFITAFYGPAAEEMAEYVALQRRAWSKAYHESETFEGLTFSPDEIEKMYQLLDAAILKSHGQPDYTAIIERELLTLLSLSLSTHPTPETADDYADKLNQAETLISQFEITRFGEGTTAEGQLNQWRNRLNRAAGGNPLPQYSENSVQINEAILRGSHGQERLPDENAVLGYAYRQPGDSLGWSIQWDFGDFIDLLTPGRVYIVRMRARAEFDNAAPPNQGVLFTLGAYTYGGVAPGVQGEFTAHFPPHDDQQYRWIELGKLQINTPNAVGYLFLSPGRDLTGDDAARYDYLEFVPEDEFEKTETTGKLPLIQI